VDNFSDSYGQGIWSLFPNLPGKCLFKVLEIPVKNQWVDFRLFCPFWPYFTKIALFFWVENPALHSAPVNRGKSIAFFLQVLQHSIIIPAQNASFVYAVKKNTRLLHKQSLLSRFMKNQLT